MLARDEDRRTDSSGYRSPASITPASIKTDGKLMEWPRVLVLAGRGPWLSNQGHSTPGTRIDPQLLAWGHPIFRTS